MLLMARLPPVERGVGADRLARWHATLGRWLIWVITGHVLCIIWGYALSAHADLVSETATLLTTYPDVLMATVAYFLLLGVGLTSLRAARRRLRYETWYYLHLYTYLAIALAFSHQFANGAAFVDNAIARFAWEALYLITAALIVWYRLLVPARDFGRHRFVVAGLRQEADRTVSVYIKGRGLGELGAAPGQFFRWRFLTRGLWWQSHPYSLSALPSDTLMRITVRDVGDPSNMLRSLRPGTRVLAEGPFGAFFPAAPRPAVAAGGRRRRDHAAAGHDGRPDRPGHPRLPGLELAGRCAAGRVGRDCGRARRRGALCHRQPVGAWRRSADAAGAPSGRARPRRDGGVRLRPAGHDRRRRRRAAGGGPAAPPCPRRVVRVLRGSGVRRVLVAVVVTVAGLVALLSFRTHAGSLNNTDASPPQLPPLSAGERAVTGHP